MIRHACVTAIALVTATSMIRGQTISFFRQFTALGLSFATNVVADSSGVYVFGNGPGAQGAPPGAAFRKFDSSGREVWTRQISNPILGVEQARKVAGAVYVLGFAVGSADYALRKYSDDGDEFWTRPVEFPVRALAADGTGVYVAGGNQSAFLRKYSPQGDELWTRQLGNGQRAAGVAVDTGGVYLEIVYSNGAAGMLVSKYDSAGGELWTRQLNQADVFRDFSSSESTGFYLIAADARGSGTYLRKYDAQGNEVWSRHPFATADFVNIAADSSGVYIAGDSRQQPYDVLPGQCRSASGGDSFIRKYDVNGVEMWTRQFGSADATWARAVTVNDSSVYVAGNEGTALVQADTEHVDAFAPTNPTRNAFLVKLDQSAARDTSPRPRMFPDCVVNAASYVGGGVAPGELVVVFGSMIGPQQLVPGSPVANKFPNALAGTRILFNGIPAALLYVSEQQSSAIVPFGVAGQTSVDVQVEYQGMRSDPITVPVLSSRPGVFSADGSGWGQALILNEDGSLNSPANAAARGSTISLYLTGGGELAAGVSDGEILTDPPSTRAELPIWIYFDLTNNEFQVPSKAAQVIYAGDVPGSVAGLMQVKFRVPADAVATGGKVPFVFIVGEHWTLDQVTVAVR
jgi:uncharacterized protein (TIGR03437 family)